MCWKEPIPDEQLTGWKYFRRFLPLLDRLHDAGTARDRAHNRTPHYDRYLALRLIFFFNPIVTSMRGLVQAGALKKVRQQLGVDAADAARTPSPPRPPRVSRPRTIPGGNRSPGPANDQRGRFY
ncbi:MAG: hypothetical protein WC058_15630 [Phycisphaeraceae bacterium]